jgi:hypothetical protein
MSIAIEGWSVHGSMLFALNTGFVGVKSKLIYIICPIACLSKNLNKFYFLLERLSQTWYGWNPQTEQVFKCSSPVGKSKKF